MGLRWANMDQAAVWRSAGAPIVNRQNNTIAQA